MAKMKIEQYKTIKEKNNKTLIIGIVCAILMITFVYNILTSSQNGVYFFLLFISMLSSGIFQAFRKRICPYCLKKMEIDYSTGIPPSYHFCNNCEVKIRTFLEHEYS
jgi:hypothetical protein